MPDDAAAKVHGDSHSNKAMIKKKNRFILFITPIGGKSYMAKSARISKFLDHHGRSSSPAITDSRAAIATTLVLEH